MERMNKISSQLINTVDSMEHQLNELVKNLDIEQLDMTNSSHRNIYELMHLTGHLDKIATELRSIKEKL
jgi:hypothetical protein